MRSIWTGSISFGLIHIPVKLFSAVKESNLDLDMLDKKNFAPIKFKRVNESTGKEVTQSDIVKGYKMGDKYVVLEDKDFEAADAAKTRTIDLINFVDEKEIDSVYYELPFYLEPEKAAQNAYALLRDALRASGKVGVTTFVLRHKESLAILKPIENVIVLNRIRFTEEIRDTSGLKLPPISKTKTKELQMADQLINQLTEKFDITKFKDTYAAKLLKVIKEKSKGKSPAIHKMKIVHKQSGDLMEILRASIASKKVKEG